MEHSRFGTARFRCDAETGPLYRTFIPAFLLGAITFGLAWIYYVGHQQAYFWNNTRLGDARFSTTMTGWDWLRFQVVNGLLALVTLGLAAPWIVVRTHRFFLDHLQIESGLDLKSIHQQFQRTGGTGEGLLDVMDMESGIDLG